MSFSYCKNLFAYSRQLTREVNVGGVSMGGENPIRIQSMTNTPTMDTKATIEQCVRIINAGADYVRITAPGIQDAENLANIKKGLRALGYKTPLIADIHFNPKAAEVAAAIVEKVRINPGNYADKKHFKQIDFTEIEYRAELEKIHSKLLPLLKICHEHGTAIRIGVNHGSLSDRIMSRYGDTPQGMVEAAMEFLRICAGENFHNLVISLKASNTRIMVQAYRLLANTMMAEGMNYPLHLGVTEAGDSEDGRIKSAVGIGTLLADGLGDTIRVSLTEDPELEIPVARELVKYFQYRQNTGLVDAPDILVLNPFEYKKRESKSIENIGGSCLPVVVADYNADTIISATSSLVPDFFYLNSYLANNAIDELPSVDRATKSQNQLRKLPKQNNYILNLKDWFKYARDYSTIFPFFTDAEFIFYGAKHPVLNFVVISNTDISEKFFNALAESNNVVVILETFHSNGVADQRAFFLKMNALGLKTPVIINRNYTEDVAMPFQVKSASDIGLLFVDGFGDGIWLRNAGIINQNDIISCSFGILQASRVRTSKTEYISCPSCGRTLFDLQTVTAQIKERTSHLKHLKIGIMGCIVNGPGEMADADYGYVGAVAGKVSLYKGKDVIKKNIVAEFAVDELLALIKECGDWKEPE